MYQYKQKERKYPELDVDDKVRIMRKKGISEKERTSHWLKGEYAVEKISKKLGQTYYESKNYPRELMRFELLNIKKISFRRKRFKEILRIYSIQK